MLARIIFSLISVLTFNEIAGQNQEFDIKHFDMRDGLSQMKVSSIVEDNKGYIWIGTRNGLNRFNGSEFQTYGTQDSLSSNRILNLAIDSAGRLVVLTDKGLDFFDGCQVESYPFDFLGVDYGLELDATGRVWIMTFSQLTIFDSGVYTRADIKGISYNSSFDPLQQELNAVWGDYVFRINAALNIDTIGRNTIQVRLYDVVTSAPRPLFIFSGDNAAYYYYVDETRHRFTSIVNGRPDDIQLPYHFIWNYKVYYAHKNGSHEEVQIPIIRPQKLYVCSQGKLWIGGENGLAVLNPSAFQHIDHLVLPYIWSIIDDRKKNIYFASYGQGLFRQFNDGKFEHISQGNNSLFHAGSAIDNSGYVHFSNNGGIYFLKNDDLVRYFEQPTMDLAFDSARNVMVAGVHNGISIFQDNTLFKSVKSIDGLHSNFYIQNVTLDSDGDYWLGSYQGLSKYHPDTDSMVNFTNTLGNLPYGPGVFSSFLDTKGVLWIGGEKGLMYVDQNGVSLLPVESSIMQNQIKGIVDFDADHLLLASKDELYLFHTTAFFESGKVPVTVLNETNGYRGIEPGFNSLYRSRAGHIYICSSTSVDVLNPELLTERENFPKARITAVGEQEIPLLPQRSTLTFDNTSLLVEAEGIGLSRPFHTKYNFKLNNEDWTGWQSEGLYNFEDLGHGGHTIKVAVGPINDPGDKRYMDEIDVRVELPFHRRRFFIPVVLSILTLSLVIFIIGQWREWRTRKRIQSQLLESRYLRSQLLLSELNPHFIFNVLASIQNKIIKGNKDEANDHLVSLSGLIRNYLDSTYRSNNPARMEEFEITLKKEIELLDAYIQFERETNNRSFEYHIAAADDIDLANTTIPPLLIQPFVENAIKHGLLAKPVDGQLNISFSKHDHCLQCIVKDNGAGFNPLEINSKKNQRTSYGMRIIKERIDLLNEMGYRIDHEVTSIPQEGTTVSIKIIEQ